MEAQNQRAGTPADFTVLWKDYQKQPPEVSYKKTFLKNFAIFSKKLQTFRPVTLLKRDPNTGVFL